MPSTPQSFIVDPKGVAIAVDLHDIEGGWVVAYTERDGSTPFSLPVTISVPTTFWFASGSSSRELSGTRYIVSAKFGTVEVAGADSSTAIVEAHNWQPETLTVDLGNGAVELANLLGASGGGTDLSAIGDYLPTIPVWGKAGFVDHSVGDSSSGWIALGADSGGDLAAGYGATAYSENFANVGGAGIDIWFDNGSAVHGEIYGAVEVNTGAHWLVQCETAQATPAVTVKDGAHNVIFQITPSGADDGAGTATFFGQPLGGGNPNAGQVASLIGIIPQTIPNATWTQVTLSTTMLVAQAQTWASIVGDDYVVGIGSGVLVDIQFWGTWAASGVGVARAINVAHATGGNIEVLDDHIAILTPAQYAVIADFEGSMGAEGVNRIHATLGLTISFFVYQDSGGDLDFSPQLAFVTMVA